MKRTSQWILLNKIFIFLLTLSVLFYCYKKIHAIVTHYQASKQSIIDATLLRKQFEESSQKQAVLNSEFATKSSSATGHGHWLNIQKQATDTVIQVFANISEFNFFEPFKSPKQTESRGSGFFINADGHIITNYHVIAQASNVEVQIPSLGLERFDASIVGVSPERDIALIKLTPEAFTAITKELKNIPFLKLGDSDLVFRSQEVLALGYPLGQSKLKSTMGIVSGRERLGHFGYIQITAPLNPGNSGGPALNTSGEVIGINSSGILDAQNVGYIIPINEVKNALNDLYSVRLLRKPTLGCIFTASTPELVAHLNNPPAGGWYIAKIFANTLLKSVGIEENDMLYEVNGHKIDMYGELNVPWSEDKVSLIELLNRCKVGDTLHFVIYRKGKRKDFSFKLEQKFLPPLRTVYYEFEKEYREYEAIGGLVIMEFTLNHVNALVPHLPELIKFRRIENQQESALIITHVFPNSQASKARVLHSTELLDTVNGEKVKTLAELRNAIKKSKNSKYLTIKTHDNMYAALSVEKILQDEPKLASLYFYKPSQALQDLL